MSERVITNKEVLYLAEIVAKRIEAEFGLKPLKAYPIPRGGIPAAYAVAVQYPSLSVIDNPAEADLFIDDIIDSGATLRKWAGDSKPFYALYDKRLGHTGADSWVIWPWEGSSAGSIEDNIIRLLEFVGEDPTRGGLEETPKRVAKAWKQWCSGYTMKPEDVLKTFEDGANGVDEMVIVKDIPIYSKCEHHLADIFGTATIAYIPNGKIVGLSKLSRLADVFARRLQVQERLTQQIANAIQEHLQPKGVGVVIKARHMCMESRGICQQGHYTITSALRGVLKEKAEARAEFMELAK